jgi:hypothetical protein
MRLVALRDTLLPNLIACDLRVTDGERIVAAEDSERSAM